MDRIQPQIRINQAGWSGEVGMAGTNECAMGGRIHRSIWILGLNSTEEALKRLHKISNDFLPMVKLYCVGFFKSKSIKILSISL